ncbi:hypothetical protein FB45DRAFT_1094619 [Roridomyces roridus]|uniref:Uncharacterized protein n=1 Tax=Roridomyces roridus TaxID=1738132 RepID=A0AAD7BGL1_9AGAR|nr:hypothetical protein FB45DRAFT_1094619 [Roridomyces roridus]
MPRDPFITFENDELPSSSYLEGRCACSVFFSPAVIPFWNWKTGLVLMYKQPLNPEQLKQVTRGVLSHMAFLAPLIWLRRAPGRRRVDSMAAGQRGKIDAAGVDVECQQGWQDESRASSQRIVSVLLLPVVDPLQYPLLLPGGDVRGFTRREGDGDCVPRRRRKPRSTVTRDWAVGSEGNWKEAVSERRQPERSEVIVEFSEGRVWLAANRGPLHYWLVHARDTGTKDARIRSGMPAGRDAHRRVLAAVRVKEKRIAGGRGRNVTLIKTDLEALPRGQWPFAYPKRRASAKDLRINLTFAELVALQPSKSKESGPDAQRRGSIKVPSSPGPGANPNNMPIGCESMMHRVTYMRFDGLMAAIGGLWHGGGVMNDISLYRIFIEPVSVEALPEPHARRVARQSLSRVEPILYHILLLLNPRGPSGRTALSGKLGYPRADHLRFHHMLQTPSPILARSVRHLCLFSVPDQVQQHVLSATLHVENLWILHSITHSSVVSLASRLSKLRHLHCRLQAHSTPFDFRQLSFDHLTHLELMCFGDPLPTAIDVWLPRLPALTHLAFSDNDVIDAMVEFLRANTALRALIFKIWADHLSGDLIIPLNKCPADIRFVQLRCTEYIKDWHMGALTGRDFWCMVSVQKLIQPRFELRTAWKSTVQRCQHFHSVFVQYPISATQCQQRTSTWSLKM